MQLFGNAVEFLVDGLIVSGTQPKVHSGNWLPGDDLSVKDFKVFLTRVRDGKTERLEVTDWLDERTLEDLEESFVDNWESEAPIDASYWETDDV